VADPAPARLDDPSAPLNDFGGAASTTWRRSFDSAPAAAVADLGGAPGPPSLCVHVCVCLYVCTVAHSSFPSSGGGKSRWWWCAVGVACCGGGVVAHVPSLCVCVCGVQLWWRAAVVVLGCRCWWQGQRRWCWVVAGGRAGNGGVGWWMVGARGRRAGCFFCFIKISSLRAGWASRRMPTIRGGAKRGRAGAWPLELPYPFLYDPMYELFLLFFLIHRDHYH
jgi:hypothetical protein